MNRSEKMSPDLLARESHLVLESLEALGARDHAVAMARLQEKCASRITLELQVLLRFLDHFGYSFHEDEEVQLTPEGRGVVTGENVPSMATAAVHYCMRYRNAPPPPHPRRPAPGPPPEADEEPPDQPGDEPEGAPTILAPRAAEEADGAPAQALGEEFSETPTPISGGRRPTLKDPSGGPIPGLLDHLQPSSGEGDPGYLSPPPLSASADSAGPEEPLDPGGSFPQRLEEYPSLDDPFPEYQEDLYGGAREEGRQAEEEEDDPEGFSESHLTPSYGSAPTVYGEDARTRWPQEQADLPAAPASGPGYAQRADRYRRTEHLGQGIIGEVYLANQVMLGREVALKVLRHEIFDLPEEQTRGLLERFQDVVELEASLSHPNLVMILDADAVGEWPFVVSEFLPGGSLRQLLKGEERMPADLSLKVLFQALHAVAYLHAMGVVHGGIKPENMLFDASGNLRLSDAAMSSVLMGDFPSLSQYLLSPRSRVYLAPEIAGGAEAPSVASDLFALGVVLYEMLVGRTPEAGAPLPSAIRPELPELVDQLFDRMTHEDLRLRFSSAGEVLEQFYRNDAVHWFLEPVDALVYISGARVPAYDDTEEGRDPPPIPEDELTIPIEKPPAMDAAGPEVEAAAGSPVPDQDGPIAASGTREWPFVDLGKDPTRQETPPPVRRPQKPRGSSTLVRGRDRPPRRK